jgi:hypothetical protein
MHTCDYMRDVQLKTEPAHFYTLTRYVYEQPLLFNVTYRILQKMLEMAPFNPQTSLQCHKLLKHVWFSSVQIPVLRT